MIKSKKAVFICAFLALVFAGVLLVYKKMNPNWVDIATEQLDFIHHSIGEVHPAILDKEAIEFNQWYKEGYESAKKMIPVVKDATDVNALLQFYVLGFKDAHLNVGNNYDGLKIGENRIDLIKIPNKKPSWLGWTVEKTTEGYRVDYAGAEVKGVPPIGSVWLSCDGKSIDEIVEAKIAPFVDRRRGLMVAENKIAASLAIDHSALPSFKRPSFNTCEFKLADGSFQRYVPQWQNLAPSDRPNIKPLAKRARPRQELHDLGDGIYWLNASDFMLSSADAFNNHQQILTQLANIESPQLIVLDVRGNSGGGSKIGHQILISLFDKNVEYLPYQISLKRGGVNEAYWRLSKPTYDSYVELAAQMKKSRGESDADVVQFSALLHRFAKGMEAGQELMAQSELMGSVPSEEQIVQGAQWQVNTKVALVTDEHCVSACLDFVDLVKQIPSLIHFGRATNADTVYTQVTRLTGPENLSVVIPMKKWSHRLRADNQPYVPDVTYEGDINDTKTLQPWVLKKLGFPLGLSQ